MRRRFISALVLAGAAAALALPSGAVAGTPNCKPGDFCAWTDTYFEGQRINWSGDDGWWEGEIADEDSSWQNNGYPGELDHVAVHSGAWQGEYRTICLDPGETVAHSAHANDRGDSHQWIDGCL